MTDGARRTLSTFDPHPCDAFMFRCPANGVLAASGLLATMRVEPPSFGRRGIQQLQASLVVAVIVAGIGTRIGRRLRRRRGRAQKVVWPGRGDATRPHREGTAGS